MTTSEVDAHSGRWTRRELEAIDAAGRKWERVPYLPALATRPPIIKNRRFSGESPSGVAHARPETWPSSREIDRCRAQKARSDAVVRRRLAR